ncbi:hypothetical protein [Streptomyces sp. NBC_01435]|uniref:hypothetical protein n=1 Tax=Streptomyces sp. NBC_01435 TaxID=2903865 RepID=UPI002E32D551|nr:hypothetical protein [Streptomyces sp. NBC_01435]
MPASKAKQAETAERRTELLRLRIQGVKYDDPRVLALGYSTPGAASKDVIRALQVRRDAEAAEASVYRQQENERLDSLLEAVWRKATTPSPVFDREGMEIAREIDLKAVDTVLKLMDRRAKLNGLDMPVKAELSGPNGGAMQVGPVGIAELRDLIRTAGDPDSEQDDELTVTDEEDATDDGDDTA